MSAALTPCASSGRQHADEQPQAGRACCVDRSSSRSHAELRELSGGKGWMGPPSPCPTLAMEADQLLLLSSVAVRRDERSHVTSGSHGGAATSIVAAPIMRRAAKHVRSFFILSR